MSATARPGGVDRPAAPAEPGSRPRENGDRLVALIVFCALFGIYLATLAPDITLWDSGEFNAAIASLGIPHPPGTPLYVLLARVWSAALAMVPQAMAVNALSSLATAAGCALLARAMARWTESRTAGIAAGLAAGGMFAVWQNATETEVYALSMALSIGMMAAGDRAGRTGAVRDHALLAYLMGLAVPLQISALVAAPAAIVLAVLPRARRAGSPRPPVVPAALALGGAFGVAAGIGVVSAGILSAGLLLIAAASALGWRSAPPWRAAPWTLAAVVALGASIAFFMLVRAPHDPGVNQGHPADWGGFVDLVARRQYDVPGLWPRRSPFWLQVANLFQYADWQVAFSLDDSVAASWRRTPITVLFGLLTVAGARWHFRRDRPSAWAMALLLLTASLGVVVVLNLRAGPSIGAGILPPEALHEARERDYFFALAFAAAGAWAGAGAFSLARRLTPGRAGVGVALAALPIALNWGAADRRREPDATLAPLLGEALLASAPPNAVLLLAGDNDSYAIWYQQETNGLRTDVTPITIPLLGADWYRAELARRHALLDADAIGAWRGEEWTLRQIAVAATEQGRPLSASVAVPRDTRRALAAAWTLRGMVFATAPPPDTEGGLVRTADDSVDVAVSGNIAALVARRVPANGASPREGTGRYILRLLGCPAQAVSTAGRVVPANRAFLDSVCNFK